MGNVPGLGWGGLHVTQAGQHFVSFNELVRLFVSPMSSTHKIHCCKVKGEEDFYKAGMHALATAAKRLTAEVV